MNTLFKSQISPYVGQAQELLASKPVGNKSKADFPGLSPEERAGLQAMADAYRTWKNSPEGRVAFRSMANMSTNELQNHLAETFTGVILKAARKAIEAIGAESVSIGINFEIELLLGVTGTLGYAYGIGDGSGQTSVFLSLGLDEGVEGGAMAGVQFGVWKSAPTDMGGYSYGGEILFDDELGGSIGIYFSGDELSGLTLTLGAGIDDGIEFQESYTFVLGAGSVGGSYLQPVYQPRKDHFLILTKLYCENEASDGGKDEVYFTFQSDDDTVYHYPTYDYISMDEGDTWECGRSVMLNSYVKITVWDEDDGPDDNLGSCTINVSDLQVGAAAKSFSIHSKNGLDERQFYIYAELLY